MGPRREREPLSLEAQVADLAPLPAPGSPWRLRVSRHLC